MKLDRISTMAEEVDGWTVEVTGFTPTIYPYTGPRYNGLRLARSGDLDSEERPIFVRHPKDKRYDARKRIMEMLLLAGEAVLRF